MAICIRNIHTKNYLNLITGFQVTVENVEDAFLGDTGYLHTFYILYSIAVCQLNEYQSFWLTKVRFFHCQSNQIWSPINLKFRIDCWSTVFRFSMHFWSPITWSAISWSAINCAYFMPIWLADSDLHLRCCAKLPSMRCEWMPQPVNVIIATISTISSISSAVKNMFCRKSIREHLSNLFLHKTLYTV